MTENVTMGGAPSPVQLDAWERLWEVLLEPEPDEATEATNDLERGIPKPFLGST